MSEISCVLVLRNRKWFKNIIGKMENVWNTILLKENGYEHRAPRKRQKTTPIAEKKCNRRMFYNY